MRHHLMLASQQLWPNLLGLSALLQRDGGVRSIHIIHTDDKVYSAQPAIELKQLCAKLARGVTPQLHGTGTTSQEVTATVAPLIRAAAPEEGWSVNTTGGTKTMFAGVAPFARLPNVEMFYREVSGAWYHLVMTAGGGMDLLACDDWPGGAHASVTLPVEELVMAQCAAEGGTSWSHNPVPAVDPLRLLHRGIENGWHWPALIAEDPLLKGKASGDAFEILFAALVRLMGRDNTVRNLVRMAGTQALSEFDVVSCTGQRIVIFDLKLPDAASTSSRFDQISRLRSNRDSLGGLGALAIAVRPGWPHDPCLSQVARGLQVQVWDASAMPTLIGHLAGVLQLKKPSAGTALADVHTRLQEAGKAGARIFTRNLHLPPQDGERASPEFVPGVLDLKGYMTDGQQRGLHACAAGLAGRWLVRFSTPPHPFSTRQLLENALPAGCRVLWFQASASRTGASALLGSTPEAAKSLARWISQLPTGTKAE